TKETSTQHDYFFEVALVDVVIEGDSIRQISHSKKHQFIDALRTANRAGLVLFSTGTSNNNHS
ncbi:long-chain fatty acid--CoA ligase, partial [bacterium]|nr:long-chain fatty acid--CoA ligase [bacterium]